jgi:hypothetical protein
LEEKKEKKKARQIERHREWGESKEHRIEGDES